MAVASHGGAPPPPPPHVLVFPFPAQGHMIPLLDLAHHLTLRGLSVTVLVTPKNLPFLDPLLSRPPPAAVPRPLVLPFPPHPSLPDGVENFKDLLPVHFLPMMHALGSLRDPILRWARSHPSPPDAIVSDFFLGWTRRLAADLGVPRIVFSPSGALTLSVIHCLWRELPKRDDPDDPDFPISFPKIPKSPIYPWRQLSSVYRRYKEGDPVSEFIRRGFLDNTASWGFVVNTFTDLEAPYLDHLRRSDLGHPRVWAVGPLGPPDGGERGGPLADGLRTWLNTCPEGSVVYVCFGSQAALAQPQVAAVAAGLERSGARFVWCVRGPVAGGGHGVVVPEGFEDRTAGRGVVVRGWAPQVAVLGHPAVGSFLTHCGWNSVMEGIVAGVALLTWPMTADQFLTARLLVEEAEVGVKVVEGTDAVPDTDELARIVAESVDGARSESVKALELRRKALKAIGEDGSSSRDLEELVEELFKLKRR